MIPTRRSSWKKISSNLSLYLSLSLSLSFFRSLAKARHIYAPTKPESGGSLDGVSIFAAAPN